MRSWKRTDLQKLLLLCNHACLQQDDPAWLLALLSGLGTACRKQMLTNTERGSRQGLAAEDPLHAVQPQLSFCTSHIVIHAAVAIFCCSATQRWAQQQMPLCRRDYAIQCTGCCITV